MSLHERMQAVHGQVAAEVALLIPQLHDAIDELARALAAIGAPDAPPAIDELVEPTAQLLARVRPLVTGIADRLADDLGTHLGQLPRHEQLTARVRHFLACVLEYTEGWVDGGGIALALLGEAQGAWQDVDALRRLLVERLAFIPTRVEAAAVQWAHEVEADSGARQTPRPPAARTPAVPQRDRLPEPPPEPLGARPGPRLSRSDLADAPTLGFPDRHLPPPADGPAQRKARFAELMAFAEELKVRVKKAPDLPSTRWLDKMEEKLTELAIQRGIAVPAGFSAPTAELSTGGAPPADTGLSDQQRRDRIDAMLAKAEKAGLKLGRVPKDPSDTWLDTTERQLEAMLEARRAERKAARERIQAERKARIERLQVDAAALKVDLGPFPAFPTDDWLARAEIRIAQVMLSREAASELAADDAEVLAAGEADPDELSVEPDPEPTIPVLLYEEGTVQEEAWVMQSDRLTVGRGRGSDVQILHDAGISRQHCAIERDADGAFALVDLGSTKGTLVNGLPVQGRTRLLPGAIVQVGDTELVFRLRA